MVKFEDTSIAVAAMRSSGWSVYVAWVRKGLTSLAEHNIAHKVHGRQDDLLPYLLGTIGDPGPFLSQGKRGHHVLSRTILLMGDRHLSQVCISTPSLVG